MRTRKKKRIYFIILIGIIVAIWVYYCAIGFSGFNKNSAITVFGSIIEGMSALLSISIAVFIFRIQSLENRNQQLEESTLNFIFQTTRLAFPKWIPSVEEGIRNGGIAGAYYNYRLDRLNRTIGLENTEYERRKRKLEEDRDTQQKRLKEALNLHNRTEQTIKRIRNGIFSSVFFLFLPILSSFYMLIGSDARDVLSSFFAVSITILIAVVGIALLIKTVLESTTVDD